MQCTPTVRQKALKKRDNQTTLKTTKHSSLSANTSEGQFLITYTTKTSTISNNLKKRPTVIAFRE